MDSYWLARSLKPSAKSMSKDQNIKQLNSCQVDEIHEDSKKLIHSMSMMMAKESNKVDSPLINKGRKSALSPAMQQLGKVFAQNNDDNPIQILAKLEQLEKKKVGMKTLVDSSKIDLTEYEMNEFSNEIGNREEFEFQMRFLGASIQTPLSHSLNEIRYFLKQEKPMLIKNECRSSMNTVTDKQIQQEQNYIEEEMSLIFNNNNFSMPQSPSKAFNGDHSFECSQVNSPRLSMFEDQGLDDIIKGRNQSDQNDDQVPLARRVSHQHDFGKITDEKIDNFFSMLKPKLSFYHRSSKKATPSSRKSGLTTATGEKRSYNVCSMPILEIDSASYSSQQENKEQLQVFQSQLSLSELQQNHYKHAQYNETDDLIMIDEIDYLQYTNQEDKVHTDCQQNIKEVPPQIDFYDQDIEMFEIKGNHKTSKKKKLFEKVDELIVDLTDDMDDYDNKYITSQLQIILQSMNLPPLTKEALEKMKSLTSIKDLKNQIWAHITQELLDEKNKRIPVSEIFGDQMQRFKGQNLSHQMAFVGLLHVIAEQDLTLYQSNSKNNNENEELFVQKF
ncbi:UNKNOWN [Stylonychia lemnae]|uniref:Uncharacterized protein n=1 Tax=Stylonychia lemnae TaxID=5949 RepID=A0A078AX79_STYLE|nr:UNKNOWN [Stylonychia lemnae]|eukprot:CDW86676.1 UNKNOWN [Stylonychia lemnae]